MAPLDALPDTQPYDTGDTVQSVFRSGAGCGTGRGGGVKKTSRTPEMTVRFTGNSKEIPRRL